MAIFASVGESLEQQHTDTFGPTGAICFRRECFTASVHRKSTLAAECDEGAGRGHDRNATSKRERTLALTERLTRKVNGDQRRAARRIDGHRWTVETKRVREAPRSNATRATNRNVAFQIVRYGLQTRGVVAVG